ncbi:glycerol kinase GlpK [Arsukibacterium indicum]|uniref:Glycerol kinase GlpK n=1 Tax=Arsukibacterium indicum TaxID=2848612 RepID=A0ABS6MRM6_9GAMM|nr:glycerol kinase GlpK [Arsukibacterium indicum]MBV2131074.1 glycerol kinase GlpK [Arsukibacterium indicum]
MVKEIKSDYILAIDQGTTSSRAVVFNRQMQAVAIARQELSLTYPAAGWVEQDPEQIWQSVLACITAAIAKAGLTPANIAAIAISNQRETTILWDKESGEPIANAIVWQDRRTAAFCRQLQQQGAEATISQKTGLRADPYFSASKIGWLLDNIPDARARANAGKLCFGTVDSFILSRLTGGKVHATDASNASRTALYNLSSQRWDPELLQLFSIPASVLPDIKDSAGLFGHTSVAILGAAIPVLAILGDQQAALMGQACISTGMLKSTYGTGCFAVVNTGNTIICSNNQLLSTLAWQLNGKATYALEGSIFMAGATVQWLRDKLGIINQASDTEALAAQSSYQQSELLIPAFTGMGAPYWQPEAKAAMLGMTRDTGKAQFAAAALCAVAYQTADLLSAMHQDGINIARLRVDGGMTANNWFLQALADLCQQQVQRCNTADATVFGVGFLAAVSLEYFDDISAISQLWQADQQYKPQIDAAAQTQLYQRWQTAVAAILKQQL